MLSRYILAALAAYASLAAAWMPTDGTKELLDRSGTNLFRRNVTITGRDGKKRWRPASGKIRGVNLGSQFVVEPWLSRDEWNSMGCGAYESEFDCVSKIGQVAADAAFQKHWNNWITKQDIDEMASYGINTIRIPVGYWMLESLVYKGSEYFPRGAVNALKKICGWASDKGFYIIIDLHGAPGAQQPRNSFTGQYAGNAGFYVWWQYARAYEFLSWMTKLIHNTHEMRNVGMLEVVNEPLQGDQTPQSLRSEFYPGAYKAIRDAERSIAGLGAGDWLHIQMMGQLWWSGDPKQYLTDLYFMSYDDHRYLKWAGTNEVPNVSHDTYLRVSCHDNRAADWPTIVAEFSISVPDNVQWDGNWHPNSQQAFYKRWFAAQVMSYERWTEGWVFWTWKTQLGDYRWDYRAAVAAGVIPRDLNSIATSGACNGY